MQEGVEMTDLGGLPAATKMRALLDENDEPHS